MPSHHSKLREQPADQGLTGMRVCGMWLVGWHSGRTSICDQRTFPVLRSTCSWRV